MVLEITVKGFAANTCPAFRRASSRQGQPGLEFTPVPLSQEYEDKAGPPRKPPSPKQNVRKNLDFEPLSTTALILEDRPA